MKTSSVGEFLKKYTMLLALVVVVIFFAIMTQGRTLNSQNITYLIAQNGYVFVLASGMLLCILTGGNIDLSVGSVVCFSGAIGAIMLRAGADPWLTALVMTLIGLIIGALQGLCIAKLGVPAFIATLAGMYAFRGLSNVIMEGYAIDVGNKTFLNVFGGGADCYLPDFLGSGSGLNVTCLVVGIAGVVIYAGISLWGSLRQKKLGLPVNTLAVTFRTVAIGAVILWMTWKLAQYKGIPTVLIWIGLVLLIYQYITTRTAIGRYCYAVGGNEKATTLSGVNSKMVYFFAYANMGLLAGFAGVLNIARYVSAQPTYGTGYEMDAIAACFIGGASAYGGVGKISGIVIGALLMGIINQGLSIMGVDTNYQVMVKGIVLLLAVMFDVLSKREKR